MKVIYLAGKYTGDIAANIQTARNYAIRLWESGYAVVTPHLNTAHFEKDCLCDYKDYMEGDLAILERCDEIWMLPNWQDSPGAKLEQQHALKKGITVCYCDTNTIPFCLDPGVE